MLAEHSVILYWVTKHAAVSANHISCLLYMCRLEVQHPDRQYVEADLLHHMQVEVCCKAHNMQIESM